MRPLLGIVLTSLLSFTLTGGVVIAQTSPVNKRCPMSGELIPDDAATVQYDGLTIGFCCPMCVRSFERLSDADKAAAFAKVRPAADLAAAPSVGAPANPTCPISGDPASAAARVVRVGAVDIGFCCNGCVSQFESWDRAKRFAFAAEHAPKAPINKACPISGQDLDPAKHGATPLAMHAGLAIGFCCERCPARFEQWDNAKRDEFAKSALSEQPVNLACPISGEKIGESSPREAFYGAVVAFGSEEFQNMWRCMSVEERAAAVKLMRDERAGTAPKPINAMCPIGKEPVDGRTRLTYKGHTLGFCCPGCDSAFAAWPEAEKDAFVEKNLKKE